MSGQSEITNAENKKGKNLFEKLFYLWAFNPFMAVLLTMYCNYFELSYYLTLELSKIKLQENDYIELCQVVQIFESSMFNNVRLKLLRPKKNIFLVKTLYALLMILPQCNSFDSLNNRIKSVKFISKFDDGKEDDDIFEEKKDIDEEISQENRIMIINKYINILKERYKEKIEYEKEMKNKKIL
jgi:vacuole morphology and inheritance protein 14